MHIVAILCIVLALGTNGEDVSSLLSRFQSEADVATKEAILLDVTEHHSDAGPQLLDIARSTPDVDTRWLAIRGIGRLKFQPATEFLLTCLKDPHHYVRANAARALGEIRAPAEKELTALLSTEQDDGVVQQTALALGMIHAKDAVPVLRKRADTAKDAQTHCWLINAIAALGSRKDVEFVAERLYNQNQSVAFCAAEDVQQLTGQDLHLDIHPGPIDISSAISKAKEWWEHNGSQWKASQSSVRP